MQTRLWNDSNNPVFPFNVSDFMIDETLDSFLFLYKNFFLSKSGFVKFKVWLVCKCLQYFSQYVLLQDIRGFKCEIGYLLRLSVDKA